MNNTNEDITNIYEDKEIINEDKEIINDTGKNKRKYNTKPAIEASLKSRKEKKEELYKLRMENSFLKRENDILKKENEILVDNMKDIRMVKGERRSKPIVSSTRPNGADIPETKQPRVAGGNLAELNFKQPRVAGNPFEDFTAEHRNLAELNFIQFN
jgi:hypothetical protein